VPEKIFSLAIGGLVNDFHPPPAAHRKTLASVAENGDAAISPERRIRPLKQSLTNCAAAASKPIGFGSYFRKWKAWDAAQRRAFFPFGRAAKPRQVGRIVYGADRADVHKMYFEARHVDTLEFVTKASRNDLV